MDSLSLANGALGSYVCNANDVIKFKLIRREQDIENDDLAFNPEYTHQFFGDSESVVGYKGLSIDIFYTASGLLPYFRMTYSGKIDPSWSGGVMPDNILKLLTQKLEMEFVTNLDNFIPAIQQDLSFKPHGKLINSFEMDADFSAKDMYVVYQADMTVPGFREYHERMQTFLMWFIDAASYIDVDDEKWEYFVLYEKVVENGDPLHYFVGYMTVYKYYAYPTKLRPRISQMLILPPFQKRGLGAELLRTVCEWYINDSVVLDITVEDPSDNFTRLRDFVDCKNCMKLPSFQKKQLLGGFNKTMAKEAQEKFKICKKQARRVYEILRLLHTNTVDTRAYRAYRLEVKKRLNGPFQRQKLDMEKLKKTLSPEELKAMITPVTAEQRMEQLDRTYKDLELEYQQVIERLTSSDL